MANLGLPQALLSGPIPHQKLLPAWRSHVPYRFPPSCLAVLAICLQEWLPWVLGYPQDRSAIPTALQMQSPGQREQRGSEGSPSGLSQLGSSSSIHLCPFS